MFLKCVQYQEELARDHDALKETMHGRKSRKYQPNNKEKEKSKNDLEFQT